MLLTALLTLLCAVYTAADPARGRGRMRALVGCCCCSRSACSAPSLALDLLLFFVFFEVVLVPMYFVIASWGGDTGRRRRPADKFILYTLLGSRA